MAPELRRLGYRPPTFDFYAYLATNIFYNIGAHIIGRRLPGVACIRYALELYIVLGEFLALVSFVSLYSAVYLVITQHTKVDGKCN
jgi:hypothetical protein